MTRNSSVCLRRGFHTKCFFSAGTHTLKTQKEPQCTKGPPVNVSGAHKRKAPTSLDEDSEDESIKWREIGTEFAFLKEDPERVPLPEFSFTVDRALRENKSFEVWDMVSHF